MNGTCGQQNRVTSGKGKMNLPNMFSNEAQLWQIPMLILLMLGSFQVLVTPPFAYSPVFAVPGDARTSIDAVLSSRTIKLARDSKGDPEFSAEAPWKQRSLEFVSSARLWRLLRLLLV